MRYYCVNVGGEQRLIARDGDEAYDLTATRGSVTSFDDLAHVADVATEAVDEVASRLVDKV